MRIPCDREEMMHLCRSRSLWALVPAPASWAELGCQGPAGTPWMLTACSLLPPAASPGRGQQRLLHLRVLGGEARQIAAPPHRPPCT